MSHVRAAVMDGSGEPCRWAFRRCFASSAVLDTVFGSLHMHLSCVVLPCLLRNDEDLKAPSSGQRCDGPRKAASRAAADIIHRI